MSAIIMATFIVMAGFSVCCLFYTRMHPMYNKVKAHIQNFRAERRRQNGYLEEEADHQRSWIWWLPAFSLLLVLAVGILRSKGKWHYIHGDRMHKWTYALGNGTTTNCNADPGADPCYWGLKAEIQGIVFWSNVLPFLPWFFGFLSRNLHGACLRFCGYIILLILFYIYYYLKVFIQHLMRSSVDFSDHAAIAAIGLTIAFAEVSWHLVDEPREGVPCLVLAAGCVVLLAKLYQSYYTAVYFHTPFETTVGFMIGFFFSCVFDMWLFPKIRHLIWTLQGEQSANLLDTKA